MLPYLIASLPTPRLGAEPAVEAAAFLDACRGFLGEPLWHDLAAVLRPPEAEADGERPLAADAGKPARALGPEDVPAAGDHRPRPHDPVADAWANLDDLVQDAIVLERCTRTRRDPMPYLRRPAGFRVDVIEAVAQAFMLPHPGSRERALDQLRWRLADELAAAAPDGFGALFARAVQLRLAWRWARWNAAVGWDSLAAAVGAVEGYRA